MSNHYIQVYDLSKYTLKSFDSVGEFCIDSNDAYKIKYNANGTVKPLLTASTPSGATRFAAGSGAFASGVATIATGLSTVTSFQAEINATSFATGATEIITAVVSGSPATGSVTLQGFVLATTTKSVTGTAGFYWMAIGT